MGSRVVAVFCCCACCACCAVAVLANVLLLIKLRIDIHRQAARLDLQVSQHIVLDAMRGRRDRIAPHLLHPALHHGLRVRVGS